MTEQNRKPDPPTTEALLAGRRFEELSVAEKATFGRIHRARAEQRTQRLVDNLRQQTAES